jgi:hypothetical protein
MLKEKVLNRRWAQFAGALLLTLVVFVGCSSDNNPAAPVDPPPTPPPAKKPTEIVISSIAVKGFPSKNWDSELIVAWRKPDIWVALKRNGSAQVDYSSDRRQDASSGSTHTFTRAGTLFGKSLPVTYLYVDKLKIELFDQDLLAPELMTSITINPSDIYANDEASTFAKTFTAGDGTKFTVRGQWKY